MDMEPILQRIAENQEELKAALAQVHHQLYANDGAEDAQQLGATLALNLAVTAIYGWLVADLDLTKQLATELGRVSQRLAALEQLR